MASDNKNSSGAEFTSVFSTDRMWYNTKLPLKVCTLKELAGTSTMPKAEVDGLYREAQEYMDEEVSAFKKNRSVSASGWYTEQFETRGTSSDRIATAAVALTEATFMFHLHHFDTLFDVAQGHAHHYDAALKALAAIWPKLLPPRPLKKFIAQYFATVPPKDEFPRQRRKVLCYWYVEDAIKRTYTQFLALCETCLTDKLLVRREAWLSVLGKLLLNVVEGRNVAISIMISKLGDPMSAVSHAAYHHMLAMLSESSASQSTVMTHVEQMAVSKRCPLKAQKYCVNIMNQFVFSRDDKGLALQCLQSYLVLMKTHILGGTIDQSITSALLSGMRRAFPFAGADFSVLEEHLDALFVLCQTGPFAQRVQSIGMIQQLCAKGWHAIEARFYRALYSMLLTSPGSLPHSSQLNIFFSVLYRAIYQDADERRVCAFVHRLLERCVYQNEAFICASLLLVGELSGKHPHIQKLLRSDPRKIRADKKDANKGKPSSSSKPEDAKEEKGFSFSFYDPKSREPTFSNASRECIWALSFLTRHAHPLVVKLAFLLLLNERLDTDLHPLDDVTLKNFLDMFADAGGKEGATGGGGGGAAVVAESTNTKGVSVFRRSVHQPALPSLSNPSFVHASPENVDVQALFMHRYAVQRDRFLSEGTKWENGNEPEEPQPVPQTEKKTKKNNKKEEAEKAQKQQKAGAKEEEEDEGTFDYTEAERRGKEIDAGSDEDEMEWGALEVDEDEDMEGQDSGDDDVGLGKADEGDIELDDFDDMIRRHTGETKNKRRVREEAWLTSREMPVVSAGQQQLRRGGGNNGNLKTGRVESRGRGGRGGGGSGRGGAKADVKKHRRK